MIFVSSSCVEAEKIGDSVRILAESGFKNIELSGGTEFYPDYKKDLYDLKKEFNLNYSIHNYFPPHKENFVLNFASLNDGDYNKSIEHALETITLAKGFGCSYVSFHAGFYVDLTPNELGNDIFEKVFKSKEDSLQKYKYAYNRIIKDAGKIKIYLENNVITPNNYRLNKGNIFMFTDYESYLELKKLIDFNILLDLAHLKVSCNALNLNFEEEYNKFDDKVEYIHLSGNDGFTDANRSIENDKEITNLLNKINLKSKTFTLEVYDDLEKIKLSYNYLKNIISPTEE